MLFALIFLSLAIAVLAVIFAVQNPNVVQVSFLIWKTNAPLALDLLISFVLGFILGLLVLTSRLIKKGFLVTKLKKRTEELEGALEKKEKEREGGEQKETTEGEDKESIS